MMSDGIKLWKSFGVNQDGVVSIGLLFDDVDEIGFVDDANFVDDVGKFIVNVNFQIL